VIKSNFTRLAGNPIISPDMPGLEGESNINGPSLILVPDWVKDPLGRYYLYFAHHDGEYIRLAYADHIEGPWTIYKEGTLHIKDTITKSHVASPDLYIDHEKKEIRMYFHGKDETQELYQGNRQATFVATSGDGLDFTAHTEVLGPFYFRVFEYRGYYYAVAQDGRKGGIVLRSKDGVTQFQRGPKIIDRMRHAAVLLINDTLLIFYSRTGDNPERILLSSMKLDKDWTQWEPTPAITILQPEKDYEGADLPLIPSVRGSIYKRVRQLRDPGVYLEGDKIYLLYSVAGESGIGIAVGSLSLLMGEI
jgi:hypothetical protein